jgi:hypothetical protein
MDVKVIAGSGRSGRRGAVAGLLAGTAVLLGRGVDTEAGKRRCPRCPQRTCCVCKDSSANPGCRFGPYDGNPFAVCEKLCGGPGTYADALSISTGGGNTAACATDGGFSCTSVGCPLY